jgi:hypothetical protein
MPRARLRVLSKILNKPQEAMMDTSKSHISFSEALTLIFITLKLLDKIDWSWWLVLSPLWLTLVVIAILAVIASASK